MESVSIYWLFFIVKNRFIMIWLNQVARLIHYFRGRNLILINKSTTSADNKADLVIHDSIGKVLSAAVNNL